MITIATESLISSYINTFAFVLLLGLISLFQSYRVKQDRLSNILFMLLCIVTMSNAVICQAYHALKFQHSDSPVSVRGILPSLDAFTSSFIVMLWVLYADYKIYQSRERIRIKLKSFYFAPLYAMALLALVNIFTGILFVPDSELILSYGPMFYFFMTVEHIYGLIPVFIYILYSREYGRPHFFSVMPVLIPVMTASVFSFLTDYSARALGFSTGMVFLIFSYGIQWRYDDEESGLYNRRYVRHIIHLARDGKRDYQSAIVFQSENATKAYFQLLRRELPKEGELIRMNEGTVLLFTKSKKMSVLSLIPSMILEAVSEYREKHPEKIISDIDIKTRARKKSETAIEFIDRVSREEPS